MKIRDSVLVGLKSTSHDAAYCDITFRSEFRQTAAVIGLSTTIKRLVSSAKSLMFAPMSFTISFMYSRNSNGPRIDPCVKVFHKSPRKNVADLGGGRISDLLVSNRTRTQLSHRGQRTRLSHVSGIQDSKLVLRDTKSCALAIKNRVLNFLSAGHYLVRLTFIYLFFFFYFYFFFFFCFTALSRILHIYI